MTKSYFTLFCREENGIWSPQFGDYVRSVVSDEARDSYSQYKSKDRKIVKHEDDTDSITREIIRLNGQD